MADTQQMLLFATVLPNGHGGFIVTPKKPVDEVGTTEAARILGYKSRSCILRLLDDPVAQKIIRWRFISERQGKILIETASLLAYRKATEEMGK